MAEHDDFNPLTSEPVIQREYTQITVDTPVDVQPIPEAPVSRPAFSQLDATFQQKLRGEQEAANDGPSMEKGRSMPKSETVVEKGPTTSFNPAMNNLDKKAQKNGSEQMVDAVLDGYGMLCGWAGSLAKVDQKKIAKLAEEGKLDPTLQLPMPDGDTISLSEYVEEYNSQTSGVLTVTQEFKDKVKPVMVRVFQKHNIGMTDEQLLLYYFGTDIISKGATIYGLRKQNQQMIDVWTQMTTQAGGGKVGSTYQPAPEKEKPKEQQEEKPKAEKPKERPTVNTPKEREFTEPEEEKMAATFTQDAEQEFTISNVIKEEQFTFADAVTVDTNKGEFVSSSKMPKFGDEQTLSAMDKVAKAAETAKNATKKRTISEPEK